MQIGDAFLLLSLPRATLERQKEIPVTDSLYLDCVTISAVQSPFPDRDVYLVIKLGHLEIPVDPYRRVKASVRHDSHIYTFLATDSDSEFSISIPFPQSPVASQDLETFNHILTQYVSGFSEERDREYVPHRLGQKIDSAPPPVGSTNEHEYEDLRGHLVLINESDGTVLGDLDHEFKINEDPALTRDLPENAPVIIELPPDYDTATAVRAKVPGNEFVPLTTREAFVRAVPPEERDVITDTATLISHAISATTTLLVSGVSYASKYYVAHSKPHTPSSSTHLTPGDSQPTSKSASRSPSPGPPLPRGGLVISNSKTRSVLTQTHAVSGKAVKLSAKTVEIVDSLIKEAVGRKEKAKPQNPTPSTRNVPPNLPPKYEEKGTLPPSSVFSDSGPPSLPPRPTLRKRDKLILSADLVFSTIEESIKRIIDTGGEEITRVVTHKCGEESGQNAALATGTARNVVLVYIDMRGIGRRAIIRKAGVEYVKGRLSSGNLARPRLDQIVEQNSNQHGSSSNVTTTSILKPPLPPRHPYERK
ncbi:hypothetical protein BDM02DRAFT_3140314 [Thelephora ganbajun]|uniref:Uncharacterized protein n=1 Tax=Thelephora ganbajun TaxID=370292 RepID=A0ACB6ZMV0_THEGA|nr:hypothetical protein BDM02DRAFT_3140314 [Thelephora ganbajun]